MGIACGVTCVILLTLAFLYIRERRHRPLNFNRYFADFSPTLSTHRGYGKHAVIPENTLPAFIASEKLGFRAHELDVRITRDGKIALLHGPRLENTTDGRGRMENFDFSEIQNLNAGHYVEAQYGKQKNSKKISLPLLSEVLNGISRKSTLNIEIKRDRWDLSPGLEDLTVRVVTLENAESRVCFSGFHFLTLWHLRRYKTGIPIGLLIEPGFGARFKLALYRFVLLPDNIHLHYSTATPALMARLKARGYGLAFWTVNDADVAQHLFENGADVVITDHMEFIRKFPGKAKARQKSR